MPEHNAAESRSHFAAWAIVSAPLVLGFDLADEEKLARAWPIISNREVIRISQTWVAGASFPSGQLLKSWLAPNVPTVVRRGECAATHGCVDEHPAKCAQWAMQGQCMSNPGYMHSHCRASCHTCDQGNLTGWRYGAVGPGMLSNGAGDDVVCLDARGQLPRGHGGSNMLHALPCNTSASSQRWRFNGTGGVIQLARGGGSDAGVLGGDAGDDGGSDDDGDGSDSSRPCLRVWATWLWAFPLVDTAACDAASVQRNERWTLSSNGTLANEQYGCVEVSRNSGPPSTIWAKPLEGGRMAVLAVNGADMMQTITLDFKKLIGGEGEWEARDVWLEADLGRRASLTRNVPPHDCVLLVLTPTPATPPTRQGSTKE